MRMIIAFGAITLCAIPAASLAAGVKGRSYDECRQLAVSRGLTRPSMNSGQRYERLQAAGLKTRPQGFIARCMAGIQD
jgi:hypothetical protein